MAGLRRRASPWDTLADDCDFWQWGVSAVTTKTQAALDVRKVLQSVKDYLAVPSRPKLSEADTRAHFIDPLLRSLGYHSIGDIQHEVYVESAKQYLDYLLVVDAIPRVAVEAKAIDVGFNDAHGAQVVQYCSVLGIEWAVVTNTRQWRLYHGFAKGPLSEKLLAAVDLLAWENDSQYNTVFELLWLISKEGFQTAGGPGAWLVAKQLDTALRKSLADSSSLEIKYIRKRLAEQAIAATTEQVAAWFRVHLVGGGLIPTPIQTALTGVAPLGPNSPAEGAGRDSLVPVQTANAPARSYCRIMLGQGSRYAEACFAGSFIGTDFLIAQDLASDLPEDWRIFNKKFIPVFLAANPDKSNVTAGLACGALWTVSKGLRTGDIALCPDGKGHYRVGQISGDYQYEAGGVLPHRRAVTWRSKAIDRSAMSEALRNSTGSIGTVSNVTAYRDEIENLLAGTGSDLGR